MELFDMELTIFKTINSNIFLTSTYDFIKFWIMELKKYNLFRIELIKMQNHMDELENTAVFMAKLMLHDERFLEQK